MEQVQTAGMLGVPGLGRMEKVPRAQGPLVGELLTLGKQISFEELDENFGSPLHIHTQHIHNIEYTLIGSLTL